ncbi:MAG: hypothetical protein EB010_10580 [Acidimicrobiia bacterium]|nr:hypothetical protein [Acidimicrobiia bacterium]
MVNRYGREGTESDGIFFTEGPIDGAVSLGEIKLDSGRQNISLDQLKIKVAAQVRSRGGNALANFKYVQQGTVFSFSNTRWRVTGTAVRAAETSTN